MNTVGPANKRKGTKTGKAQAPKKTDAQFGSRTDYAAFSKCKAGLTGKK
jgi:hypothetical protein